MAFMDEEVTGREKVILMFFFNFFTVCVLELVFELSLSWEYGSDAGNDDRTNL